MANILSDIMNRIPDDCKPWEEYTTFWLWVKPELLKWHCDLQWLFSPVNDRKHYTGDLWGIDANGQFVIVETKLVTKSGAQDPFCDFRDFSEHLEKQSLHESTRNIVSAANLHEHWSRLLDAEVAFIDYCSNTRDSFGNIQPEKNTYSGVLPYSSKRLAVRKFPKEYWEQVVPYLTGNQYRLKVDEYLSIRDQSLNPVIHFVGLMAFVPQVKQKMPGRKWRESFDELCDKVGNKYVHLKGVTAAYPGGGEPETVLLPISSCTDLNDKESYSATLSGR